MENKDLLFMLDEGEEFIKGKFVADENKIYYLSADENELFDNIDKVNENILHIYEENKAEFELLMQKIKDDNTLMDRIKGNPSKKLLFRYENKLLMDN